MNYKLGLGGNSAYTPMSGNEKPANKYLKMLLRVIGSTGSAYYNIKP